MVRLQDYRVDLEDSIPDWVWKVKDRVNSKERSRFLRV